MFGFWSIHRAAPAFIVFLVVVGSIGVILLNVFDGEPETYRFCKIATTGVDKSVGVRKLKNIEFLRSVQADVDPMSVLTTDQFFSIVHDTTWIRNGEKVAFLQFLPDSTTVEVAIYSRMVKKYNYKVFIMREHVEMIPTHYF